MPRFEVEIHVGRLGDTIDKWAPIAVDATNMDGLEQWIIDRIRSERDELATVPLVSGSEYESDNSMPYVGDIHTDAGELRATFHARELPEGYADPASDQQRNLTTDVVVFAMINRQRHILLAQRNLDSDADPGKWALPGGYVDVHKGEDSATAAVRELEEETGIVVSIDHLHFVDTFDTPGRDPRNNISEAYAAVFDSRHVPEPVAADDVRDAGWVPVGSLAGWGGLAFDHADIIAAALRVAPRF